MRIHIVPTYNCNLKCRFCYASGYEKQYGKPMSYELFGEVLDYYAAHGLKSISFLGGEPTTWPHLNKAIEYAKSWGLETVVFSNGSCVSAVPDLIVLNITRFLSKPFSSQVLRNIEWYRERSVQINFRINLTKHERGKRLDYVLSIAREADAEIQFAAIGCFPYDVKFGEKIYSWLHRMHSESFRVRVSRPLLKCVLSPHQYEFINTHCDPYKKCDFAHTVPVINPDGKTVFPCNSIQIPLPLDYVFSQRNKFQEIEDIRSSVDKIVHTECLSCEEYKGGECHGGCLGAQIKAYNAKLSLRNTQVSVKKPKCSPNANATSWDWEMASRIIAKSIFNHSFVTSGYIKVGYACNNRCSFCVVEGEKHLGNRTFEEITREIDRLTENASIGVLHYSGGEPTLRKDLPRILSYARDKGISQQIIQSNGRKLRDVRYLKELVEGGATSFFVSLHGTDASVHDALVRSEMAFAQTCGGLENLNDCGVCFSTNTVITRTNAGSLYEIMRLIFERFPRVSKSKLSYPNLQGAAADNAERIAIPLWDCIDEVKKTIRFAESEGRYVDTESIPVCLLGNLSDHACEFLQNPYNISDLHYRKDNWRIKERAKEHIFYDQCDSCDERDVCCGFHVVHDNIFGFRNVLNPISFANIG